MAVKFILQSMIVNVHGKVVLGNIQDQTDTL